jgi:hypothetical protein
MNGYCTLQRIPPKVYKSRAANSKTPM